MDIIPASQWRTIRSLCLVTVRREQLEGALGSQRAAAKVDRILFMLNQAGDSSRLFAGLPRQRVVLGFPGAAGHIDRGVVRYVDIPEQPTVIEATAPEIAAVLRGAGFRTRRIANMDAWLSRHAVFITAIAGALCEVGIEPGRSPTGGGCSGLHAASITSRAIHVMR